MPLDHYISQVHLKNFYSPILGNSLYAIRKSDLNEFPPRAQDVCRKEEGSTNPYLSEPRAIEEFLRKVEPKYNESIKKFESNAPDNESIYSIAGFIAYVLTCSPTGMRLSSKPLERTVEQTSLILDAKNAFPPPPPELGYTMTELIERKQLEIDINPKYPQAIGIQGILSLTSIFGNSFWEILHNPFKDNPFFTSDFPIAIEFSKYYKHLTRIIPLSPQLAVRIIPNKKKDWKSSGLSFSNFQHSKKTLRRHEVINLNRQIVRCAEDLVFYRDNYTWVYNFIKKNRKFYIKPEVQNLPSKDGTYMYFFLKIVER